MSADVDTAVIGAGVVGLAVARALAVAGRDVIVLERHGAIGEEASSRNSEVIHAGIYYRPGSLRARLCVSGKDLLYAYCAERHIDHQACGKLVVAQNPQEEDQLKIIAQTAWANKVAVELIDGATARALEPALACSAALLSPTSGIVDSHALMLALQGDMENAGGTLALHADVQAVKAGADAFTLEVAGSDGDTTLTARQVVNAAGLDAPLLARRIDAMPPARIPGRFLSKGQYFYLSGKAPFSRLIYPIPGPHSLGLHYTLDLGGQGRFGPDVTWIDAVDYTVDEHRAPQFADAVRAYWPAVAAESLRPGYAGIRPKIAGPDNPPTDFVIQGPLVHGIPGLVNLFGIDSPGLTSALAIGDYVCEMLANDAVIQIN